MKNSPMRAKRVAGIMLTLGFVVGLLAATAQVRWPLLIGIALVAGSALLFFLFWRCQACHRRLPLQSKDPITQCPYCGEKLD